MNHILVLSGGIGGSKLVDGLAHLLPPGQLVVLGNTGDDVERHGLWISPDIDIVTYTLAGVVDRRKGWGFAGDTFHTLDVLRRLGEDVWMNLGDRDLGTHLFRTRLRREDVRPTEIARRIAEGLGVRQRVLLPTDDPLQTIVLTDRGRLNFQEFFLREGGRPDVRGIEYAGAKSARPTPEALQAIAGAECILFAPSNPVASVGPILAVPGIREALLASKAPKTAVCPLIAGRSLKGPSDRMLRALGYTADVEGVAEYYGPLLDGMIMDEADRAAEAGLRARGLEMLVTSTVMRSEAERKRLAGTILQFRAPSHDHAAR